jgi:hypothetical protein
LLEIDQPSNKWGQPYYCESMCPGCKNRSIISEKKNPNGETKKCHNCSECGVVKISGG